MPSTFRSDVRTQLHAYNTAFKAANPTMVLAVFKARPGSLTPPCLYIAGLSEPRIVHDSGLRQRTMAPQVALVQRLVDAEETGDLMDDLVDAYLDYLTANPHLTAYTVIAPVSTADIELDFRGTIYSATLVTIRADIQEGRN